MLMSFRFRFKVGPIVYDERIGERRDDRPALLTRGDLVVLALCAVFLIGIAVMAVVGG